MEYANMKHCVKIFPLALGIASVLSLLLLIFPWSLFSQNSSPPSPDFNGNGIVDIPDFLLFVDAFGSQEGRDLPARSAQAGKYDSKYDLDGNSEIGFADFLLFVDNFGKVVKRLPPTCMPTSDSLHPKVTLSDRTGQYQLTLVEVVNGTDARSAQGTLTLRSQPSGLDSLGSAATPLYGFTNVNLRAVGAYEVGDPDSEDPQAPGVLVLESSRTGARRILLRLGADANRRDDMLFDGAYTVLEVHEIAADGFAGNWRSGARSSRSEGYFCARRVSN